MLSDRHRARTSRVAALALALTSGFMPAMAHAAAESARADAGLQVEPSVGATLSLSLRDDVTVRVFSPGWQRQRLSNAIAMPGMVLSFNDIEVVTDSEVSLQVEHRAAAGAAPGESDGDYAGGALVILAQFN